MSLVLWPDSREACPKLAFRDILLEETLFKQKLEKSAEVRLKKVLESVLCPTGMSLVSVDLMFSTIPRPMSIILRNGCRDSEKYSDFSKVMVYSCSRCRGRNPGSLAA